MFPILPFLSNHLLPDFASLLSSSLFFFFFFPPLKKNPPVTDSTFKTNPPLPRLLHHTQHPKTQLLKPTSRCAQSPLSPQPPQPHRTHLIVQLAGAATIKAFSLLVCFQKITLKRTAP
ncbi:hypothetical protein RchiOBHm_Chr3g0458191 [Rosa chinensis]|uniref:Uncharacterized protein n=1 Tax=Rosa chinensis TaxID=74649 RepID=A0A2P6R7X0_ROSCH|nr:hypothetical protein RchiOBHm_Chr3g0458191 [Rosa chinensis]